MANRIVIGCTPRTGSNLLINALAQHPQAINAHEVFSTRAESLAKTISNPLRTCNLFKVFIGDEHNAGFTELITNSTLIYLYREDLDAQLTSWTLARVTGIWTKQAEHIIKFPPMSKDVMIARINLAKAVFEPKAKLTISYEYLTNHWDEAIEQVLTVAGWDVIPLAQTMEKQV